jgi:hypothetical protein
MSFLIYDEKYNEDNLMKNPAHSTGYKLVLYKC